MAFVTLLSARSIDGQTTATKIRRKIKTTHSRTSKVIKKGKTRPEGQVYSGPWCCDGESGKHGATWTPVIMAELLWPANTKCSAVLWRRSYKTGLVPRWRSWQYTSVSHHSRVVDPCPDHTRYDGTDPMAPCSLFDLRGTKPPRIKSKSTFSHNLFRDYYIFPPPDKRISVDRRLMSSVFCCKNTQTHTNRTEPISLCVVDQASSIFVSPDDDSETNNNFTE